MRSGLLHWPALLLLVGNAAAGEGDRATLHEGTGRTEVRLGGRHLLTYVPGDAEVRRPYFKDLHAPGGTPVTRTHPPVKGRDALDHATMHPGLWLAFGDLGGVDFWRNKGKVVSDKIEAPPGVLARRHRYLDPAGASVATEELTVAFMPHPAGVLLRWSSTFRPTTKELVFGDQEEMGLGVRLAAPLTVARGGGILDADGRRDGKGIWGKTSAWCEYFGKVDGRRVGVVVMPHPKNFRPSWWHARDYGLLVANPFGRRAFTRGTASRVVVRPGESLRLAFGILVYAAAENRSPATAAYASYLELENQK